MKRIIKYIPSLIYVMVMGGMLIKKDFFLMGGIFLMLPVVYEFIKYVFTNEGPLNIETPDGSNQPYHPSVLFFENKWNGYNYWMAYTPFPIGGVPYRDRWEYPCICVSNDGIEWTGIGDNNPLDDLNKIQIKDKDYFSDTHLVFNQEKNRIECYYRLSEEKYFHNNEKGVWLFRRYSYDGISWSDREIAISPCNDKLDENGLPRISPSIIKEENYKMWYVISKNQKYTIYNSKSKDGVEWSKGTPCYLENKEINPWHIDCQHYNGIYYLLTYDFSQKLILWQSKDGINFKYIKCILTASHKIGSFYKMTLYRSCIVQDSDGYKVYFSAGNDRKVKIGLMGGKSLNCLLVKNVRNKLSIIDFVIDYLRKYFFVEIWILWRIKRRINERKRK